MGCCISHPYFQKETVYEVTLDADGVAQRVPKGQGTHYIHISPNNETHLEEKSEKISPPAAVHNPTNGGRWPTLSTPSPYSKRVHPDTSNDPAKEENEKLKTDS